MNSNLEKIGLFLATFNEIEAQSYAVIRLMPSDELTKYASKLDRFESRIRFLQALLRSSKIPERTELEALFTRALALSSYRNSLSHNPLRIRISQNQHDKSVLEDPMIVDSKKGKRIPQAINQLKSKLKEAESVLKSLNKITADHTIVESWDA